MPPFAPRAAAHPLGNFTINLYSRLEIGAKAIGIVYVVDMAEIPTYQEFGSAANAQEQTNYLTHKADELRDGVRLLIDGEAHELVVTEKALSFLPGQGGLMTTRMALRFSTVVAKLTDGTQRDIAYQDTNYAERLGWHEVVARPSDGAKLLRADVPSEDMSHELRVYPQDMLSSPRDVRTAHLVVVAGGMDQTSPQLVQPTATARSTDRFAALITTEQLSPRVLLLTILLALALGALHALSPGHGKTIVGAYLVGTRGTARHAFFLGLTVTTTHTIGVFVLGLITLYASRFILPEQLYPWLGVLSGVMIVVMGLALLRQRVRVARAAPTDDHEHDHSHGHQHHHVFGHEHGPHTHTHLPSSAGGSHISWRNLLALGVSGGLIPCPSALIVMLSAIGLGRVGFGLLLIIAFSVGLAGVLTSIGLLFVYGGQWISRMSGGRMQRLGPGLRLVPVASALFVTTAGLVITGQAMIQAGLLH
jgi:ABC-type nickel/cobalt efflux system permease component RcnA